MGSAWQTTKRIVGPFLAVAGAFIAITSGIQALRDVRDIFGISLYKVGIIGLLVFILGALAVVLSLPRLAQDASPSFPLGTPASLLERDVVDRANRFEARAAELEESGRQLKAEL